MTKFDVQRFAKFLGMGHGGQLGILYHAHQDSADDGTAGWVDLALPYAPGLIGDPAQGTIAAGPVLTLLDMATSIAIWARRGQFSPHATLDLRIDHLRSATPGATVIGRGECYRLTPTVAFVRGHAHDGDPADPVAQVVGTFMLMGAA